MDNFVHQQWLFFNVQQKQNKMENPNLIFFGDAGLTAASANHIANLAKEYVQDIESKLNNFQLYRSSVALIGTQEQNVLSEGVNDTFFKLRSFSII